MNLGRTVFAQLISFLPDREFRRCVSRYDGDRRWRGFSCWDQFLCMAFAQLTYRESLRDIEACLRSLGAKLYHMGFRSPVARSTLADANESRDGRIYADFAQVLIRIWRRRKRPSHRFRKFFGRSIDPAGAAASAWQPSGPSIAFPSTRSAEIFKQPSSPKTATSATGC